MLLQPMGELLDSKHMIRMLNVLEDSNLVTMRDLLSLTRKELLALPGFGAVYVDAIEKASKRIGL